MSKFPPLKCLPVFISVGNNLSFSLAAKELNLTHSAVSQSIRQLENYLGKPLFNRTTKQVELTEVGKKYLVEIELALNKILTATESASGSSDWVNINLMNSLAMHLIIPNLQSFYEKHKNIKINLATTQDVLTKNLQNGDVDLIITPLSKSEHAASFAYTPLWDDDLVLVYAKKLYKKSFKSPVDLLSSSKAIYVKAKLRENDWPTWCRKNNNIKEPRKASRIYFVSTAQAIQAAISGAGVFVTHMPFIVDSVNQGVLSIDLNSKVSTNKKFYAICRKDNVGSGDIGEIIDFISNMDVGLVTK